MVFGIKKKDGEAKGDALFAEERIERRKGKSRPEWRAVAEIRMPGKKLKKYDTGWHERTQFWMEYALIRRKMIHFIFDGLDRPPSFLVAGAVPGAETKTGT